MRLCGFDAVLTTGFSPSKVRAGTDLTNSITITGLNLSSGDSIRVLSSSDGCIGTTLVNHSAVQSATLQSTSSTQHVLSVVLTTSGTFRMCILYPQTVSYVDVMGGTFSAVVRASILSHIFVSSVHLFCRMLISCLNFFNFQLVLCLSRQWSALPVSPVQLSPSLQLPLLATALQPTMKSPCLTPRLATGNRRWHPSVHSARLHSLS